MRIIEEELIGKIYNRWKILRFSKKVGYAKYFLCQCLDCNKEKEVYIGNIIRGRSKSCGCKSKASGEQKRFKNKYLIDNNIVKVFFNNNTSNFMVCDIEDWEKMKCYMWYMDGHGYARTSLEGKHPSFHRMILNINDTKIQVDHINKNKLDNRRINLRIGDNQKNSFNKNKYANNTSGFKGVYYDNDRNKWRGAITINGKSYKSPKRYNTPEEAYEWYIFMSNKLFKDFSVFISDEINVNIDTKIE